MENEAKAETPDRSKLEVLVHDLETFQLPTVTDVLAVKTVNFAKTRIESAIEDINETLLLLKPGWPF